VTIRVNDRRLVDAEMLALGVEGEKRADVFRLIDRRDKMKPEEWERYAGEIGLDGGQINRLTEMLSDPNLWQKSAELLRFFTALDALGARAYVCYDPAIVRGLDYYTGVVFEAADRRQPGRAILGGGRYDNLVKDVGGQPVAATGFAMGDVMVSVVLKERGLLPEKAPNPAQVLVTVFDESRLADSLRLGNTLRRAGIPAATYPEPVKMQKQLKYADKLGIRWVVIAGPDEIEQEKVTIKDLAAGEQVTIPEVELGAWVKAKLAAPLAQPG
jgi:histidyl-tRNA synthetase